MLQQSKLINSRNIWKEKAVNRAEELREARKTKKRQQDKIAELKAEIKHLQKSNSKKNV